MLPYEYEKVCMENISIIITNNVFVTPYVKKQGL